MHRGHNQKHCWIKIPVVLVLITQTFEHEQLSHNSVRGKLQFWPGMDSSVSKTAVATYFVIFQQELGEKKIQNTQWDTQQEHSLI